MPSTASVTLIRQVRRAGPAGDGRRHRPRQIVRERDWHQLHAQPGAGPRRCIRPGCRAGRRDLASGVHPGGTVTPVRPVVVDDHMIFREGLRALLGRVDDIEIVGEAATTQEAIEITEAARPDVVLMDLHLPGNGGEAATTTILASHPEIGRARTHYAFRRHPPAPRVARRRPWLPTQGRRTGRDHSGDPCREGGAGDLLPGHRRTGDRRYRQIRMPSVHFLSSPSASTRSWTGWPGGCPTTRSQREWASASRRCRTMSRRSCSSSVPPTARRLSPSPVTLGWAAAPNLPGPRDAR